MFILLSIVKKIHINTVMLALSTSIINCTALGNKRDKWNSEKNHLADGFGSFFLLLKDLHLNTFLTMRP